MTLTSDGLIRGGTAEREFARRDARVRGAWMLWDRLVAEKLVASSARGMFRFSDVPEVSITEIVHPMLGGDGEIGAWRFLQDFAPTLGRRWFALSDIEAGIEKVCAHVSDGIGALLGGKPFVQCDDIYQARRRAQTEGCEP